MQESYILLASIAAAGIPVLTSCTYHEPKPAPGALPPVKIQRDLELVARVEGTGPVYSWWPLSIAVDVVNRSSVTTHPIVMPGDGSGADWREPHAYFTTDVLAEDGTWTAALRGGVGRCGVYDPNWLDEVVRLAPGESQRLQWMGALPLLPERGQVRIRAHYAYKARPPKRAWGDLDPSPPPGGLGGMQGVEPFELVSAPIELTLAAPERTRTDMERDLALELTREGSTPAHSWEPQRFRMKLINRSALHTHRVVRPSFTRDQWQHEPSVAAIVQVDGGDGAWRSADRLMGGFYDGPIDAYQTRPEEPDWRPRVTELAPGQALEFELPASRVLYAFRGASAARMSVRYEYMARPARDADGEILPLPESLGAMASTPPFHLQSNEITWPVRSPLEIEVLPRADRDPMRASSLSDCVRIVLRNSGDEAVEVSSAQAPATLEISASGLIREQGTAGARGRVVIPPLSIPPHGEISFLEDPAINASALVLIASLPHEKLESARAEALLHRPGWIDSFRATWQADKQ